MKSTKHSSLPQGAKLIDEFDFPLYLDDADTGPEIDSKISKLIKTLNDNPNTKAYVVLNRSTNGQKGEDNLGFDIWEPQLLGEVEAGRIIIIKGDKKASSAVELYIL
jgi:hypothetical protein